MGDRARMAGVSVQLRPLALDDRDAVLALNEEVVHKLAPMDEAAYRWYLDAAELTWAAEVDGAFAGFVLVLGPGHDYDSDNYRWFAERWDDFWYLDRVAVAATARRRGVGAAIYDALQARATADGRPVLLEVNVEPPNEASLAFHRARGFVEVGRLAHGADKTVSLQVWNPPPVGLPGQADRLAGP